MPAASSRLSTSVIGRPTSRLKGIGAMLAAVGCFSVMDAAMKLLVRHYPPFQVSCLRGAAALPFVVLGLQLTGGWPGLSRTRWRLQALRGAIGVGMLTSFIFAVKWLSLADAYAIFFAAPLLITALSVPFLGERVEWQRWLAIVVGLGGVLAMLRPTGHGWLSLAGLGALGAALGYAVSAIVVRVLSRTDTTGSMNLWYTVSIAVGAGTLAAPGWVPLRGEDWTWIAIVGALGAAGQHFITEAFSLAPATVVAPFEYTAMLWGVGLDLAVWGVLPNPAILGGASVVIASGLYLLQRERTHLEADRP
jgi:drug/metabolite transporter (DMT)-like permease